ncbi:MAG TPA: amidohydrolase [Pseudomonadales bacterium]
MQPLTVSLIQTATRWHDPPANRALFDAHFAEVPDEAALVVLPEMFSTGFTMAAREVAEPMSGPTVRWLRSRAEALGKTLCGSVVIEEGGACYNRFVWMPPDGRAVIYDKRHRFRMAGEHEHYAAGRARPALTVGEWRIRAAVCYDLRFPVWLRSRGDYDLLVVVANWPAARQSAWSTLLRARAIENLAFTLGVNIVGTDGAGIEYRGGSVVYDSEGTALLEAGERTGVFTVTLDGEALRAHRQRFPAWQDADDFDLAF